MTKDPKMSRSQRQERQGMMRFGGHQNPRSGAGPTRKNDGRTLHDLGNELIEFKRTDNKKSITLKLSDLLDVEIHALGESRFPILGFDLGGRHYIVMPEEVYLERTATVERPSLGRDRGHSTINRRGHGHPVDGAGEMQGVRRPTKQPVLRRVPGQSSGGESEVDLPRRGVRRGLRVPGQVPVPEVRDTDAGTTRSMGRGLRARAAQNPPRDRSDPQ